MSGWPLRGFSRRQSPSSKAALVGGLYSRRSFFLDPRQPLGTTSAAVAFVQWPPFNPRLDWSLSGTIRQHPWGTPPPAFSPAETLQLRNHTEVTGHASFCIFPVWWADISFSDVHGWARTYSIGFRRPRRRTRPVPIPMCPSSVSPAPGFISFTRKPGSSWATSDCRNR